MEIPNFLGKLKGEGKSEPKKFLALVLTDQIVQAAVWHVKDEKTEIVTFGTPVEWDGETGTTSELVSAADATISVATEGMETEPTEMVIGVAHGWTDKDGILGVKRELIKTICKELELKALGFVVLTDSILRYLKMQEGTPATSILIQVSRDEVVVVLVRLGRTEATEVVGRSDDIVADVEEGISRFPVADHLPSRIILESSSGNPEEFVQNLVSNDWQNKFNFLHLPKIESLPKDIAIRAVAVAGGTEVAKAIGFSLTESAEAIPVEVEPELTTPQRKSSPTVPDLEINASDPGDAPEPVVVAKPKIISGRDAGFTIGGSLTPGDLEVAEEVKSVDLEVAKPKASLPKLPHFTFPKFRAPKLKIPSLPALIALGSLTALLVLIFLFIWLLPKSTVTLTFTPKPLEESVELTLSPTASTLDSDHALIPVVESVESVSGQKTAETTGKKTIGDPAAGNVTIYNRTSLTKTFLKGTSLTAKNLKFSLDSDVTVASKSAGSDYVDVPGKATVAITAVAIGEDGNLPSGTEFTLASFAKDTYVAKNDDSLKGGSSKEIQAVSETDQSNLAQALVDQLIETTRTQVESLSKPDSGYYISTKDSKITKATYSAKVGTEASTLEATIELDVKVYRYNKADIASLVSSVLTERIPSGYVQVGAPPAVELESGAQDENGDISATAKVTIGLIPQLDHNSLAANLKGKSSSQVQTILATLPSISGADVKITPLWLPPRLKSMPRNTKNINIIVVAQ